MRKHAFAGVLSAATRIILALEARKNHSGSYPARLRELDRDPGRRIPRDLLVDDPADGHMTFM